MQNLDYRFLPVKGAFTLGKKSLKFHFLVSQCVGVAVCGSHGVGQLRCGGVVVWGSHSVGELRCGGVAV